jgi:hypothetical protein
VQNSFSIEVGQGRLNIYDNTLLFYRILLLVFLIPILPNFFVKIPATFAGFNFNGWAWIIMLSYSLMIILIKPKQIKYYPTPFIGWILYLILYSIFDPTFLGIQLTLQYIAMFVTGMAASTYRYNSIILKKIFTWFVAILAIIILLSFLSPESYIISAAFVMSLTFGGILLSTVYFSTKKIFALIVYCAFIFIIFQASTRMALFLILLIAPVNFFPYNPYKRILIFIIFIIVGFVLFYSQSIQQKSFFTGKGEITDISLKNENFRTSGRTYLYDLLYEEMDQNPWIGQGPRADLEKFQKSGIELKEAHNDYISVRYNFGWIGLILLLSGFTLQIFQLFTKKKFFKTTYQRIIYFSVLTAFVAWAGFMYSDNILKYSTYFGNYHFCLIGILYSIYKSRPKSVKKSYK